MHADDIVESVCGIWKRKLLRVMNPLGFLKSVTVISLKLMEL